MDEKMKRQILEGDLAAYKERAVYKQAEFKRVLAKLGGNNPGK